MLIGIILISFLLGSTILIQLLCLRKKKPDGEILITETDDGKKLFSLELLKTPDQIETMKQVTFKIVTDPFAD